LDSLLILAQSKVTSMSLTQKLPESNVPISALRRDWRRRLEAIKGARITGRLSAVYSVLKRQYEVLSDGGVDEPTNLLCIDRKADRKLSFYEALADHLFLENRGDLWAYGLLRAIESRYQPTLFNFTAGYDDAIEIAEELGSTADNLQQEDPPKPGHGVEVNNLEPVVPQPEPLSDISDETKLSGKKKSWHHKNRPRSSTDDRRNSIEEEEQKLSLKEKHYALHCQACLGRYDAIQAAPPQSYVYLPRARRKIVEAHHVDHLQNSGAIGAKNLLVLCNFHHDYLGDRLSSVIIKDALAIAQRVTRNFPSNADGTTFTTLQGLLVQIKLDAGDVSTELFFTDEHAKAWTEQQ
jgi:hypothetical protein